MSLQKYPLTTQAHCNWDARPSVPPADVSAVERTIDAVRLMHPFVAD